MTGRVFAAVLPACLLLHARVRPPMKLLFELPRLAARFRTLPILGSFVLAAAAASATPSTTVVISQVYGGGGNNGATYKNDFIELHNISGSAVSVAGWSVQYNSTTGTSTYQVTNLTGSIAPGGYYLVQEAAGTGGSASLPTADVTGSINMSATGGKVALVNSTTALPGSTSSVTGGGIVDFVGFGTANLFEGSAAAPVLTNTTAAVRADHGSTDTDQNGTDFTAVDPTVTLPHNSASTAYTPAATATKVQVETAASGAGTVVGAQALGIGSSLTAYAVSRSAGNAFVANVAATWSLTSITGGVVAGDLVAAGDGKSATFTPHAAGTAVIHAVSGSLTSVDSGTLTVSASPTNPAATASADSTTVTLGQNVVLTITVTPGTNPASTSLAVTGDLSAIGGSATQAFTAGAGNTFTYTANIPTTLTPGAKSLSFSVQDAQSRTASTSLSLSVRGNLTIFHTNDTHARVTPHKWVVPQHTGSTAHTFESVGGAAYMGAKMLSLVTATPDALVLDGGDISEGNPVGDWNGPGNPTGSYGNGTAVEYYKMLDTKLRAISGRSGRGLDAMVVGNHDIRDISYINNMKSQTSFPVISINICAHGTHTPYFAPYVILNVNGNKIGVIGYTTESSDSPESAVNSLIDVVKCDWSSSDSTKIHFADYVNDLRNNQGCNLVILLTHMGHSGLCTPSSDNTPILVDNAVAKVPEIAVTGHWHTWTETVWQPAILNYKTIFTEAASFEHYVGELRVNGNGKYLSNANYPLRNSEITPDADIAAFIQQRKDQFNAASPTYQTDQVIGYSADDLLLDNYMKWWSSDEYPWSGNNTAGNWICDSMQWKAQQLFGSCDLGIESGGGVRSDIPAGPVTYTEIYETFPWPDDTLYLVKMTGQEIWNYFKAHGCDVGLSSAWHVTASDGVPTAITYNGNPIDLAHQYDVAINNYMYLHDTVPFSDPSPRYVATGAPNGYLARTALVEYTATFTQASPYHAGPERYTLNTEFSGGYRAVVTMMNDADSSYTFDDAFIRFLTANPETLQHLGTRQVPADFVNADGTVNAKNRLAENEMYRSYLGFKTGLLHPGDIIETWGKGSFYQGDPEWVDQEGTYSDGVEFKIVGHDDSLAKPVYMPSIAAFWNDTYKNHYVKFVARKTGTNTVADQSGQTITVMDVTAYTAKTLPGNTNDLLLLTGIPTMENFALRFRCDSAVLASTAGISALPASPAISSRIDALAPSTQANSLTLTATTTVNTSNEVDLTAVADAQVESGSPGTNLGTSSNLFIQSSTTAASSFGDERSWLRFDLSSLPAGATITSATLEMFCWRTAGASLPAEVRGIPNDSWTETGITWNNQPDYTTGAVLSTQTLAAGATNVWYGWDVTAFAQSEQAGDKLVSLVAKPVTEGAAATAGYGFDAKEFGATGAYLKVTLAASGTPPTVTQVQYFYRYSSDNSTWGAWTSAGTATTGSYAIGFNFPSGYGYYEFYTVATDSNSNVEPTPAFAQTSVHYTAAPAYTTAAVVTLGNLSQTYDGTARHVSVTTVPPNLASSVTYNGSATAPSAAGSYSVAAVITQSGYTGSANDTFTITADAYTSFATAHGLDPATTGAAGADPDGDGISNLMEFVLGGDPTAPNRGILPIATLTTSGGHPALVYSYNLSTAAASVVTTAVEYSPDLVTWTTAVDGQNGVTIVTTPVDANTNHVTVTIPTTTAKVFARLHLNY